MATIPFTPRRRFIAHLILFISLAFIPLIQPPARTAVRAAAPPVWIDYDIHQSDVIQVKLFDDLPLRARNGRLTLTDPRYLDRAPLSIALNDLPDGRWLPLFAQSDAQLNRWRQQGVSRAGQPLPDLALYFRVQLPDGVLAGEALAQFRASALVEGAYPVSKPVAPPLPPDYETRNNGNFDAALNLNIYQRYLDAAPDGMDVRYAWEGSGGRGSGIDICDVEYGWTPHSDLPNIINIFPPTTIYNKAFYDHGTAVLGMLGAKDNGWGTTGMIPDAAFYFSPVHPAGGSFNVASAILTCLSKVGAGDVLLIEQQESGQSGNFVPSEWDSGVYAAIQTAVANGVIVVEAAGNGSEDLDDAFYQTAKPGHAPFTAANDSGAIIVGSAKSPWTADPRTRNDSSTYGDTVDLQGWGMHLIAPGYGSYYNDDGDSLNYTLFSGTSGASPMITAAAAIIQANTIAKDGSPASPASVKQRLQTNSVPQESVNGENIGPMPDLRAAINDVWGLPNPVAPVITPASGAYNMPIQVAIDYGDASQNSSNTNLRYTLDGSEPTVDSFIFVPEFGDVLYLNYGVTVRARAFSSSAAAGRFLASDTATAIYTSTTPKVATPQISPTGGTFSQGTQIIISASTSGAAIKYRTDCRAPSFFYPGTTYNGPITLSPGTYEIAARAYKDGYYKSDPAYSNEITITPITLPAPAIYPNGGDFAGSVTVYIGSTVLGAKIHYTTDGSTPTESSPQFTEPLDFTNDAIVTARVFLDGYTPSNNAAATFNVTAQVADPIFSPVSGSVGNSSLQVTLSSSTPGATIRYTTNGAVPTSYSTTYTGPFNLDIGDHTIKARAFLNGATPSNVVTANYTVYDPAAAVATPTIDPANGNFNGPITVTLASDTEGVFLFYTLDGTDPQTSPSVKPYNGPFQLTGDATYFVRARAFKSGLGNSNMGAATLVVVNPTLGPVADPAISPPGGQYTNTISVQAQAPDFSSPFNIRRLYVTTDGVDPVADFSTAGNGSGGSYQFSVSSPQTVKALSAQTGWFDSNITSAEYTFVCDTPAITAGGTFTDSVNVGIATGTSSASIYYTTDGSEPTTADMQYSGPFTLTQSSVVQAICVRNNFEQSETAVSVFVVNQTPVAPSITTQPQNQTADACSSVTFTVAAAGSDPLSYEWRKNGSIIANADEPELTLAAVVPADAGNYTVSIFNSAGGVTSGTAVLTVTGSTTNCGLTNQIYLPVILR